MAQKIIRCSLPYEELTAAIHELGIKRLMLVHDAALPRLSISRWIDQLELDGLAVTYFSDFNPNPDYRSVVSGLMLLNMTGCDGIMAVGGGSAMDVAKCIKLWAGTDFRQDLLSITPQPNDIPLIAMPTTAGTGSEATRYAVIYKDGEKQSVTSNEIIPGMVILDPDVLTSLPPYQRCSTMLDALCHAVESSWSVNSTEESRVLSFQAIRLITTALPSYLANTPDGNKLMQEAAFLAGRAINITQTTAGHAMCYKLTSLYHIAHGHAAALCVSELWPWLLAHADACQDPRGQGWLNDGFAILASAMGARDQLEAAQRFRAMVDALELPRPQLRSEDELELLVHSVNPVRLKNNPVPLSEEAIRGLYKNIFGRTSSNEG